MLKKLLTIVLILEYRTEHKQDQMLTESIYLEYRTWARINTCYVLLLRVQNKCVFDVLSFNNLLVLLLLNTEIYCSKQQSGLDHMHYVVIICFKYFLFLDYWTYSTHYNKNNYNKQLAFDHVDVNSVY